LGVGIGVVSRLYRGEEDGGARGVSYESSGATGAG
jgi:hypothetical protein